MNCLLFGAEGYIGRNLAYSLNRMGHEVIIPKTSTGGRLDLTDPKSFVKIDWDVDVVYMFAGVTGTGIAFDRCREFVLGNELILLNLLNSIRHSSARPRVIFPSTRLVYMGSEEQISENAAKYPKTIYSVNKIACENYLNVYANAFDIPNCVLRICVPYANLIGEEYSFGTTGNFIQQAKSTGRICLYGDGKIRRTLTHIDDLCRIIVLAAEHPNTVNRTYNVPGENMSLHDTALHIAAKFKANIEYLPWPELDARIESGSTVFDGVELLKTLNSEIRHRYRDWTTSLCVDT